MLHTNDIIRIGKLFSSEIEAGSCADDVVRAMQNWFYALPKYTKISNYTYTDGTDLVPIDEPIVKFLNALRAPEIEADKFMNKRLLDIFGETDGDLLCVKVEGAKLFLDNTVSELRKFFV